MTVYIHVHKYNINTLSRYVSLPLYTSSFLYFENTYNKVRDFPVMCAWKYSRPIRLQIAEGDLSLLEVAALTNVRKRS